MLYMPESAASATHPQTQVLPSVCGKRILRPILFALGAIPLRYHRARSLLALEVAARHGAGMPGRYENSMDRAQKEY